MIQVMAGMVLGGLCCAVCAMVIWCLRQDGRRHRGEEER